MKLELKTASSTGSNTTPNQFIFILLLSYSYRVKSFMNKMIRVNTCHAPDGNANPSHLPEWLLKKLGLKPEEEGTLPLHLHLGRIYLPAYFGEKNDLCITSAPRPYFMGTAEFLGKHAFKK